jgi:predicted DNA binding CopG/RHH family protein
MSPKGNKSDRRGHPPRVGGKDSKGTIQMTVRLSVETFEKVKRKLGKLETDFAGYVRELIEKDLKK